MSFLDYKHKHYKENAYKWVYASDHLTAAVLDELDRGGSSILEQVFTKNDPGSSNVPYQIDTYLQQRRQGESNEAYQERQGIADYTPLFTYAVTQIAGMAWSNENDRVYTWQESELGDPDDRNSIMYQIWRNADGCGTDWDTMHKLLTSDIIALKEIWTLVEGVSRDDEGNAENKGSIKHILPQDVPDWIEKKKRLTMVKARSTADLRDSLEEEPSNVEIFHRFEVDGWAKYVRDDKDKVKEVERGTYGGDGNDGFRFKSSSERATWQDRLPIFKKELPIRVNIGYVMARKCNSIYNMESARDFQLWSTCFPKVFLDVLNEDGSLNTELYDEIKKCIKEGSNAWPGNGHKFDSPPVDGADIRNQTIEQKIKLFMKTFFQIAGDQARERTAAEVKVDFKAGVEAFLGYIVTTLDEIENEELFLLEQVNFPEDPSKWGKTTVKRSTDFSHIDIDAEIDRAIMRWLPGGSLPPVAEVIKQLFYRAAERDKLDLSQIAEADVDAAIAQALDQQTQANDVFSSLRNRRLAA